MQSLSLRFVRLVDLTPSFLLRQRYETRKLIERIDLQQSGRRRRTIRPQVLFASTVPQARRR